MVDSPRPLTIFNFSRPSSVSKRERESAPKRLIISFAFDVPMPETYPSDRNFRIPEHGSASDVRTVRILNWCPYALSSSWPSNTTVMPTEAFFITPTVIMLPSPVMTIYLPQSSSFCVKIFVICPVNMSNLQHHRNLHTLLYCHYIIQFYIIKKT